MIPLYEKSKLQTVHDNFRTILSAEPSREEIIQKFISENLILLNHFNAERIWVKAPILTKYVTDFAILNASGELIFIEIEKPVTRLVKDRGGTHSELIRAVDQTQTWLHTAREHYHAVLDCIGVEKEAVTKISAVVIAGRDRGYPPGAIRELKGRYRDDISFLTYDDLLNSLATLVSKMQSL